MQKIKWLGVAGAIVLLIACFFPWATIESRNLTVSGVHAEGTAFGKPGYFHFVVIGLYFFFLLINKTWSRYITLFLCAINIAWAFRNFTLITTCQGGECPVKHTAIYLLLPASLIMLVSVMLIPNRQGADELQNASDEEG